MFSPASPKFSVGNVLVVMPRSKFSSLDEDAVARHSATFLMAFITEWRSGCDELCLESIAKITGILLSASIVSGFSPTNGRGIYEAIGS